MPAVQRHRMVRAVKDARLVHVVPDAVDALGHERPVQPGPPGARLRPRVIREIARPRPHFTRVPAARRLVDPVVARRALIAHKVPGLRLHAGVDHPRRVIPHRVQIVVQRQRIGEAGRIEREDPVPVHVVDVEPDHVARNIAAAKFVRDPAGVALRRVRIPALVVPQRPQRRLLHPPDEIRQADQHVLR